MAEKAHDNASVVKTMVSSLLENFDCQPVLFVGSGLARRYLGAPDWEGTLRFVLDQLPEEKPTYEYLVQKHEGDKVAIGSEISNLAFEWAWSKGKKYFPVDLFSSSKKSVFMKHMIANMLKDITPSKIDGSNYEMSAEIVALGSIRPHAFITTNYDNMLEIMFQGYEGIVGKQVLRYNLNAYGEVYHIHGSVEDPGTIVINQEDYEEWNKSSKYFAAKLLTYFAEHPVFILGYSLTDDNVRTVLTDIGAIVADETGMISNVIQVIYRSAADGGTAHSELAVPAGTRQFRVPVLYVESLLEVFEALTARHELKDVNPALVRALAARAMQLTRSDIPNGNIEVDYKTLEGIVGDENALPTMLGITHADDVNKSHPYTLSIVGEKLGFTGWNGANKLLDKIKADNEIDIKSTDNKYHCAVKVGKKDSSISRKYSDALVRLLEKVRDGDSYKVKV